MDIHHQVAQLTKDGWQSRSYTLTTCQAYCLGTLMTLPFTALAGGIYRVFLLERAVLLDATGLILLAVAAVSLPIHEGLHGLGWKLAGHLEKGEIKFLFQHGLPMCACCAVLSAKAYLAGVLLPFLLLGGGSMVFLFLCPGTVSVLAALVNLLLPGADLLIACKILRSGAVKITDSTAQAGFTGLCPPCKP